MMANIDISAILCVLVYSVVLNFEKTSMSAEDEQTCLNLLEVLTFIANSVIFIMAGIVATESVLTYKQTYSMKDFITLPFIYVEVYVLRFIVLMALTYATKWVGYNINWRDVPLLVFGGIRGSYTLVLALGVNRDKWIKNSSTQLLVHVIWLVFFSVLFNSYCMKCLIMMIHKIDETKVMTMRMAFRSIFDGRYRAIKMLKGRKELAQTNWLVVEDATHINFPYNFEEEGDVPGMWSYIKQHERPECPECRRQSFHPPNIHDTRQQILKRKKVQFRKCYNDGLLTSSDLKKVLSVIDSAYESPEQLFDVKHLRNFWNPNKFLSYINDKLVRIPVAGPLLVPELKFNQLMFRIYTIKYYPFFIYFINMIYTFIFLDLAMSYWQIRVISVRLTITLQLILIFLYLIFIADFIIQVLTMTTYKYFQNKWNLLDFMLLMSSTADMAVSLAQLVAQNFIFPSEDGPLNMWLRGFRTLHLLRVVRILNYYGKQLYVFIDSYMQRSLMSGCSIAQCYIKSQEEIIRQLETMYDFTESETYNREVEQKNIVLKDLAYIYTNYPAIPISVKTKHVTRQVLNDMMNNVNFLNEQGLIDDKETMVLKHLVNKQIRVASAMKLVDVFPPDLVVKQIPWLFDDLSSYILVMENSETEYYQHNDNIITAGEYPNGLKILVSGVASSEYVYSEEVAHNLKFFGYLPNCDFMTHLNFDKLDKHEDILHSGSVIGELGLLTQSVYNYTVKCSTNVTVLNIPWQIMKFGIDKHEDLEENMWKTVSTRIAFHITKSVFRFQKTKSDTLRYMLQMGFVPKLIDFESLELGNIADCCFLIQGAVTNPVDQSLFVAPTFIPETVRKIHHYMPSEREVKMLIIPVKHDEHFTIESYEPGKYRLVEAQSLELCEHHAEELAKRERETLKQMKRKSFHSKSSKYLS